MYYSVVRKLYEIQCDFVWTAAVVFVLWTVIYIYEVEICCNFCKVVLFLFFYEKAKIICVEVVLCLLLARAWKQYFYTYTQGDGDVISS